MSILLSIMARSKHQFFKCNRVGFTNLGREVPQANICPTVTGLQSLNDALVGTDRISSTPLPAAYRIAITQITWLYVVLLPPQLFHVLKAMTIPATMLAAYIILGIALIGSEIENPFGYDVNDLPLDAFCDQIQEDLAIIMSKPKQDLDDFVKRGDNKLLWPVSRAGYIEWAERGEGDIRQALGRRPEWVFRRRKAGRRGRTVDMMDTVHEEV
jgi:ion channel-forming bestrophin family protein